MSRHELDLPAQPQWLDQTHLSAALAGVPGQISEAGRRVAQGQYELAEAKAHLDREEAFCYQAARIALTGACGKDSKGQDKDPTEAQVKAHMRTDSALWDRYYAAYVASELAEARHESLRSDYRAVCLEADMIAEASRNARAEMAHLDPSLRFGQIGRSYPAPQPIGAPRQVQMGIELAAPGKRSWTGGYVTVTTANGYTGPVEVENGVINNCEQGQGGDPKDCQMCAGKCLSPKFQPTGPDNSGLV